MAKPLKEYKPKDILLSFDAIQNVTQNYTQQQDTVNAVAKFKELTISFIAAIISNIISIIAAFSALAILLRVLVCIIGGVLIIYTAICASRWYEAHKKQQQNSQYHDSLENLLLNKVQESIRYTAIVRVVYKYKGEMRYLVGGDYFLPHCSLIPSATVYEQSENIIQSLHDDFQIQARYVRQIIPIDDQIYFSIKPIHTQIQMNAYVFYDVEIIAEAKEKLIEPNERRRWMSLDAMKRTPDAVATNKDVIDLLSDFPKPKESFINLLGNINIIWNITSACGYDCAICATNDDKRTELSIADKLTVLHSISTAKHLVKNIDFAGGDPFFSDDTINIIQAAIGQIGFDKVSVTTTGMGIANLSEKNIQFSDLIKHCEITIDAAHGNLSRGPTADGKASRNASAYCKSNIEEIDRLLEHAESLTINIPIINDDLDDNEISNLVKDVVWIKEHNPRIVIDALLIRLMPVGRYGREVAKDTYEKYNPIEVAKKIKSELTDANIPCKLHCSFRVLSIFNDESGCNYCPMLENKIGIDCAGNVFACAWGGYLPVVDSPTKNPFYLGNLTKVNLISILEGQSKTTPYRNIYREIDSNKKRHFCSVVSYYAHRELFSDYDYLSMSKEAEEPI